jgi:hypothetical protein
LARPVLAKQRHLARAARATGHPKNHRIGSRLGSRLKEPKEVVFGERAVVERDVACQLLYRITESDLIRYNRGWQTERCV